MNKKNYSSNLIKTGRQPSGEAKREAKGEAKWEAKLKAYIILTEVNTKAKHILFVSF